jgi:ubiquinone/menaquinone biosynthesis C-methylase UbiE
MPFDYESYYQKLSPIYDKVRLDKKVEFDSTLDIILESCRNDTKRILDIGCGSGRYAQALSERGFDVIGVDRSKSQLKQASKIITTVCCEATALPFDDGSFDLCTMLSMIHHMSDAERISSFCEAFRVLSDNGCLIIKTCSHSDLKTRLTSSFWPQSLVNDLLRYPTVEKVADELSEFTAVSIRHTKTSIELPKEECLEEYRSKKTTNIGMLNDDDFATGIARMEDTYKTAEYIKKCFCYTFLIARKRGEK